MSAMPFPQPVILENERVLLRPLKMSDYDHLLPFTLGEPDIWYYSLLQPNTPENLEKYIRLTCQARDRGEEYPFIVYDKQAGQYAGSTRFYDIKHDWKTAQLGYTWYGKAFQRTGLNRHCKLLLFTFAFESWGLERLELRADANNSRSIAAMKAIGCVEEGILRSNMPAADASRRRDSIVLSVLKNEWFGGVKAHLVSTIR
jgi:N-acetyltransferase